MIYLTCPSCGYFIGNKIMNYETKKKEICDNPKYSDKEKELEITKLIKSLNIRRYCCKMRLMTCKDVVQDILPIPQE